MSLVLLTNQNQLIAYANTQNLRQTRVLELEPEPGVIQLDTPAEIMKSWNLRMSASAHARSVVNQELLYDALDPYVLFWCREYGRSTKGSFESTEGAAGAPPPGGPCGRRVAGVRTSSRGRGLDMPSGTK
jgi:hypothetical protein